MKYEGLLSAFPPAPSKASHWGVKWLAHCCTIMRHSWGRLLPGPMHRPTLLAGLWEAGSWTELLRTWGKETQEISTPLHQFSHIPIKLNPTMRNNFPPGSDPQMLQEWTLCFPHHKIIQVLTRRWLASGTRSQNLQRAWRKVLMILPSGASIFDIRQEFTSKDYSTRRVPRMPWD